MNYGKTQRLAENDAASLGKTSGGIPKGARHITPRQQLWGLTTREEHGLLQRVLGRLTRQEREDMCLALVAWLRFRVHRQFADRTLQVILWGLIAELERMRDN